MISSDRTVGRLAIVRSELSIAGDSEDSEGRQEHFLKRGDSGAPSNGLQSAFEWPSSGLPTAFKRPSSSLQEALNGLQAAFKRPSSNSQARNLIK